MLVPLVIMFYKYTFIINTYSVVSAFRPLSASWAILEMLLLDKSIRLKRRKFANAFGGSSVMKFCSRRLKNTIKKSTQAHINLTE